MKVVIAQGDIYIPTWNGNKDLPQDEQIKIHYKFPTTNQRERYVKKYPAEIESGHNIVKLKIETDDKAMFRQLVTRIENLEAEDKQSGQIKKIEKPEDLLEARGVEALYDEITAYLLNAQAIDVKN